MSDIDLSGSELEAARRFGNLRRFDRSIAATATNPRWTVYALVVLIAGLSWFWLSAVALTVVQTGGGTELGPASGYLSVLGRFFGPAVPTGDFAAWLVSLCVPQAPGTIDFSTFLIAFAMWAAMSAAMMLPSAAPMLRTYADIADVASGQGKSVVSILVLLCGYLAVWLGFAALAAGLQLAFITFGVASDAIAPVTGFVGASLLALAGLYQFSALKNACLEKCRNPFSTLFGRWSDTPLEVFKLGIAQGIFCLGCCWALMLVMFVVGTMNLVWMAFFTLFAVLEKSGRGKVTSRVSGCILLGWGGILFLLSAIGALAT